MLLSTGQGILGYNSFSYCGNNPVARADAEGRFWDTVFDLISLGFSIIDVIENPNDPWAWIGLAGDIVDLVPFVTCVGETTKLLHTGTKIVDKIDDGADIVRAVNRADDLADAVRAADKVDDAVDIKKATDRARSRAVSQAWKNELNNVLEGKTGISRVWKDYEIDELIETGKVKGYQGHHMKSVKGYPELAGDPSNIQFLKRSEHLRAHGGNWRNITHGRFDYK